MQRRQERCGGFSCIFSPLFVGVLCMNTTFAIMACLYRRCLINDQPHLSGRELRHCKIWCSADSWLAAFSHLSGCEIRHPGALCYSSGNDGSYLQRGPVLEPRLTRYLSRMDGSKAVRSLFIFISRRFMVDIRRICYM